MNRSIFTETTIDHGHQLPEQGLDLAAEISSPDEPAADLVDLAPYSTRMRVILGLSLLSWLLLAAGIYWLIRRF